MDSGPRPETGLVWCFTFGCPSDRVLDDFIRFTGTEQGMSWVIVPIHTEQTAHADDDRWLSAGVST